MALSSDLDNVDLGPDGPLDGGYERRQNIDLPAGYTYLLQLVAHDLSGPARSLAMSWLPWKAMRRYYDANTSPTRTELLRFVHEADPRNSRSRLTIELAAHLAGVPDAIRRSLRSRGLSPPTFQCLRQELLRAYRLVCTRDLVVRLCQRLPLEQGRASSFDARLWKRSVEFGHAMVQPRYRISDNEDRPLFDLRPSTADLRAPMFDAADRASDRDADHGSLIDWAYFFELSSPIRVQRAKLIDARFAHPLFAVPAGGRVRNVVQSLLLTRPGELPLDGESIANGLGLSPLTPDSLRAGGLNLRSGRTPLLLYILREAAVCEQGRRLGPLGSVIIGSAFAPYATSSDSCTVAEHRVKRASDLVRLGYLGCDVDFTATSSRVD